MVNDFQSKYVAFVMWFVPFFQKMILGLVYESGTIVSLTIRPLKTGPVAQTGPKMTSLEPN